MMIEKYSSSEQLVAELKLAIIIFARNRKVCPSGNRDGGDQEPKR